MDRNRQTGRTTKDIAEAPEGSIYVWPEQRSLSYPKNIARNLGRDDLVIESRSILLSEKMHGNRKPIILDHETVQRMTRDEWDAYRHHQAVNQQ